MVGWVSHRALEANVYVEVQGLDFEDFEPGQVFEHRPGRTFTAHESALRARRSLDLWPPLADRHYADRVLGGDPPVGETLVLGVVTALTTKTFGRVVANLGWKDVRFPRPVHAGDTVYAESEVLGVRESRSRPGQGVLHIRTRAVDQRGEEVCAFERHLLVYRRGHGPHVVY